MAATPTIQSGSKTLSDGSTSMTIVRGTDTGFDTTVTATKTILFVSYETAGTSTATGGLNWELTDGDTITVARNTGTGDCIVQWRLVEFSSGVTVQHVSSTIATSQSSKTETITEIDQTTTWIIASGAVGTQSSLNHVNVRLKFDSNTVVSATRNGAPSSTLAVKYQVVTHDSVTVTAYDHAATTTTNTTESDTITAVSAVASTALFATVEGDSAQPRDSWWSAQLTTTTNINYVRNVGTSGSYNFTAFVVEFTDGSNVYWNTYSSASDPVDVTITAVTLARSVAISCGTDPFQCMGEGKGFATTTVDQNASASTLFATTTHRLEQTDTAGTMDGVSMVIEFAEAASGTTLGGLVGSNTGLVG